MTITDSLLILTTLLSPLIAVQVQKAVEQIKERRTAQRRIFYSLMATRAPAGRVSPEHVQALNRIDLEFSGSKPKEREVVNRWRIYADQLNTHVDPANEAAVDAWHTRGDDLFVDLLEAMSVALHYNFDRVQLRRGIYYPKAFSEAERKREVFEREVLKILTGEASLPMKVTELPVTPEAYNLQMQVQQRMLNALAPEGALKVTSVQ